MGVRGIKVFPSAIEQFLKLDTGLPPDLKIINVWWDPMTQSITLAVQSKEWSAEQEGSTMFVDRVYQGGRR
jgi:hypothetical protein